MKSIAKILLCALAAAQCPATLAYAAQHPAAPPVSAEETRQASAIAAAPSAMQKIQLLEKFLAAHPESPVRGRLLTHVGVAINRESDATARVALAEKFSALMSTDTERAAAGEILADSYLIAGRVDNAFQTVAALPNPEAADVRLLARLVVAGANETRQRNLKHLAVSQKYGALALRAIEAGAIPGGMSAARWADYKSKTLASLHQSLGLLALHAGAPADGVEHFRKATALAPDDPQNFLLLGVAINEGYLAAEPQMKLLQPGPTRDDLGKKLIEQMSQIVDAYAHAVALSAGSAQEETFRAQVLPDLESYYKFLHNGSLNGLQELIAKYKKQ
jgi:hypothetical protein